MVGNKAAVGMGDAISVVPNPADFGGKRDHAAKFPGYVVYVAYRQPFLFRDLLKNKTLYTCFHAQ